MRTALLALILCSYTGCSLIEDDSRAKVSGTFLRENRDGLMLEESVEDLAKSNIDSSGTAFLIPFKDDHYAWERAQYFLQKYVGDGKPPVIKLVGDRFILTNRENPTGNFNYEIIKDNTKSGFRYAVICEVRNPIIDRQSAEANARNLSRFIREGNLEASLLVK